MELLEIQSGHDLTAHITERRPEGPHSYLVSCRQFMYVLDDWRKPESARGPSSGRDPVPGFMTLAADRIWMTETEISQVVGAIQSAHSPVTLT